MRRLFLVLSFLVCVGAFAQPGSACRCEWSDERFAEAKAVFYGKLLSAYREHSKREVLVKLSVERVFKGSLPEILSFRAAYVCSYNFKVGERYLIYAGQSLEGTLESAPCRILHQDLAEGEMRSLEKGEKPKTPPGETPSPNKAMQRMRRKLASH